MKILIGLIFFVSFSTEALEFKLPLSKASQNETLDVLASALSHNFMSSSLALGSRSQGEVGFATKIISLSKLSSLNSDESYLLLPQWSLAKGLYRGIDVFVQSSSFLYNQEVSAQAVAFKWSFWQSEKLPLTLGFFQHLQWTQVKGFLNTRAVGLDLVLGLEFVKNLSLYLGGGTFLTHVFFEGNYDGKKITESGIQESLSKWKPRGFLGFYKNLNSTLFMSSEVQYSESFSFSFKVGFSL